MEKSFPEVLINLVNHLRNNPPFFSKGSIDGRINSSINEDELFHHIEVGYVLPEGYTFQRPRIRAWYDFSIENIDRKEFIPINIKITDTTHSDNLNCKLGIYYSLTGLKPDFGNEIAWKPFFERLAKHLGENDNPHVGE
ncbi:MAG TPA: hypothetical protein DDY68_00465, partial [Porphyromonadaceae bacterium]|nr:hypothetical protein [Porphyromonadaceae bacterium]